MSNWPLSRFSRSPSISSAMEEKSMAPALRKQSLARQRKGPIESYSIEDMKNLIPIQSLVNPYVNRLVVLCKDGDGRVGLRVRSINKGIFVCLVTKGSPAAMGGLRFGDQILQINGENLAGFNEEKVHDIFKRCGVNNIVLAVRDRPFERTLTLHKDSAGHLGFQYKDGKITGIIVESSAARNGLLIDHNLLEVNGQNVVGVKDKEISKIIDDSGDVVTVTVIPSYLYQHMMKSMAGSLVRKMMDHSIPDM